MSINNPVLVLPCYKRIYSLKRLLNSLLYATYNQEVVLFFCIDFSDEQDNLASFTQSFDWPFGQKIIHLHKKRLGLEENLKFCASLSGKYGSVIILEDDLFVAPGFYKYAQAALQFAADNEQVAGISLYSYERFKIDESVYHFYDDGFDNYYLQTTSTRGQAFTHAQWKLFEEWISISSNLKNAETIVPYFMNKYGADNWELQHNAYLIATDRYILNPRKAFSTNFGEMGTHHKDAFNPGLFQVPLQNEVKNTFNFSSLKNTKAKYDAFWENELHLIKSEICGISAEDIDLDLNGYKPLDSFKRKYVISSKRGNKVIASFSNGLKPIELNLIYEVAGNDLFLNEVANGLANQLNLEQRVRRYFSENQDPGVWLWFIYKLFRYFKRKA